MTLDAELDRIFEARDRNNMQPAIESLVLIARKHPQNPRVLLPIAHEHPQNPRVLYEVGGAYDTAGQERTAASYYERALQAWLSGDELRRCYVQYGSTLRNLGELAGSAALFERARAQFPGSASLAVFEAITLHACGRLDEAVATLVEVVVDGVQTPDLDRYKPAIRGNASYIRSLAEDPHPDALPGGN